MPNPPACPILLLAAALLLASPDADARKHGHRHGHGRGHGGWVHARAVALRGWFRHVVHDAPPTRRAKPSRPPGSAITDAAERAALAERRRSEVAAYLRDHPALALRE